MIFVTTGTSLPHDDLIKEVDELKGEGILHDKIYAQIGHGKYIPKNMTWLRFVGNIQEAYERAEIVISNCGAGTILENVVHGRKLIAVQNPDVTGGHEWELLSKLEMLGCLMWCREVKNLLRCIDRARIKRFKKFVPDRFDTSLIISLMEEGG